LRRPEEEQVRREPAPQFPLEGVIGPGLMERRQELADAGAIEADRAVPHDLLEGGGLLEARLLQPQLVIGMDRAACPRRAIEGLWRQWQQRALLLGLDEPGDLAGGAMHAGARQFPTPGRRARLHVGEVEEVLPAEEVLADVGDPPLHFRFTGGVARDSGIDGEAARRK
jgi:hypothetical protein